MILSAQSIRKLCQGNSPMITPFTEKGTFDGLSYGLSHAGYDIRIKQDVILYPNTLWNLILRTLGFDRPSIALASTIEKFDIPDNVLVSVTDKSTWARRFLSVYNTIAEPGWKGYLTLELTYDGKKKIHIKAGSPIAQMIFMDLDEPTSIPYAGKYQNQEDKPVESREEKDGKGGNTSRK